MSSKRSAENEASRSTSKRQRQNTNKHSSQVIDQTYGQRAAFGDLRDPTVPNDNDLEWEDETDALAYLMSVRQEAHGIPNLLVASKPIGPSNDAVDRSIYADGKGDFRGFYQDGAYTALPEDYYEDDDYDEAAAGDAEAEGACDVDDDEEYSDDASLGRPRNSNIDEIHEAYYTSLIQQYLILRRILHSSPPDSLVASLPSDNPTEVDNFGASPETFRQWSGRIMNTDPLPAQIASMHKDGVVRLLRIILTGKFFRKGQELHERTSRWLWALLARLPDKGELYYQEIGWIRELGKRAVLFMVSLAEAEILHQDYDVRGAKSSDDDDGVDLEVDEGLEEVLSEPTSIDDTAPDREDDLAKVAQDGAAIKDITSPADIEMPDESDLDEGEVSAVSPPKIESTTADVEMAKSKLLAQLGGLDGAADDGEAVESGIPEEVSEPAESLEDPDEAEDDEVARAKANVRATLNMILTVAGEFYGQRDLLEFRDPFGRILEGGGQDPSA
ncbi:aspartyl-trna synthetase protein [Apiospora arundinis]